MEIFTVSQSAKVLVIQDMLWIAQSVSGQLWWVADWLTLQYHLELVTLRKDTRWCNN